LKCKGEIAGIEKAELGVVTGHPIPGLRLWIRAQLGFQKNLALFADEISGGNLLVRGQTESNGGPREVNFRFQTHKPSLKRSVVQKFPLRPNMVCPHKVNVRRKYPLVKVWWKTHKTCCAEAYGARIQKPRVWKMRKASPPGRGLDASIPLKHGDLKVQVRISAKRKAESDRHNPNVVSPICPRQTNLKE